MATMVAGALTGLVLASILVTGCSDAGSGPDSAQGAGKDTPSQASTGSSAAVAGAVGSEDCSLDPEQLSFVVRDWGRVFGSIGRGDHPAYTGAFATLLDKVRDTARGCTGSSALDEFRKVVRRIDARSRRPTPDYALYDAAITHGNAWLDKVGYGKNALLVG